MQALKTGSKWQDALIQADYLLDAEDDARAARWRFIGTVQQNALILWEDWGKAWTATELRQLVMARRTKTRRFEINGNHYALEAWFAYSEVIFTLYVRSTEGRHGWDGFRYKIVGNAGVRRKTLFKHGVDMAMRSVADRLWAMNDEPAGNEYKQ